MKDRNIKAAKVIAAKAMAGLLAFSVGAVPIADTVVTAFAADTNTSTATSLSPGTSYYDADGTTHAWTKKTNSDGSITYTEKIVYSKDSDEYKKGFKNETWTYVAPTGDTSAAKSIEKTAAGADNRASETNKYINKGSFTQTDGTKVTTSGINGDVPTTTVEYTDGTRSVRKYDKATGTSVEKTTNADGSKQETKTNADGSSYTTATNEKGAKTKTVETKPSGMKTTTTYDSKGNVTGRKQTYDYKNLTFTDDGTATTNHKTVVGYDGNFKKTKAANKKYDNQTRKDILSNLDQWPKGVQKFQDNAKTKFAGDIQSTFEAFKSANPNVDTTSLNNIMTAIIGQGNTAIDAGASSALAEISKGKVNVQKSKTDVKKQVRANNDAADATAHALGSISYPIIDGFFPYTIVISYENKKSYKQMPKWKVAKYAYENKDNADADIRNEAKKYLDSVNQKTMDILKKKLEEKDNRSSSANNQRKPRVLGNIADQLNQIRLQEEQQHKQEKAVLHDEVVSQSDQIQQMEQYVSENIPENDPGQTRPQVQPQPNYLEEAVQELQQAGISITPDKMNEICIKGMQKESKDLKRQIDNLQKQLDQSIFVAVSNGCPPEIVNEVKKLNDTLAAETKRYVTYRETLLQAGIDIEKEQQEKQQEKNTQLPPEVQAGEYLKDNIKDGLETMEKNRKEIDRAASASNKSEFFQQLPNKILRNSMRHEREACICNAEAARKLYKKAASIRNKALKRQSAKGFGGKLRRSFARLANTTMFHDGKPIHEGMSYYELTRYNKLMTAAQTLKDMSQENYKKWEKMKDKFDRYKDSRDTYHEKNGIKSSKAFDKMVEKVTVESNRMANEKKR